MPKFLKYILYFIGGYVAILGLISLINTNSKCNIISSGSCSTFDAIQMMMLLPLVIPSVMLENNAENRKVTRFQEDVRRGVESGDRGALENCIYSCYFISSKDDPDPKKTENYEFVSAQKLVKFDDDQGKGETQEQLEYMLLAYWKLSQVEAVNSNNYKKYINRSWELLTKYNQNNDYKLSKYDYGITGIGGSAFLLKHDLFTKEYSDKAVQEVFDGCMFDPIWKLAKYNSQSTDTEILHSCMAGLSEYLYRKKLNQNLMKPFDEKWHAQWDKNFKN